MSRGGTRARDISYLDYGPHLPTAAGHTCKSDYVLARSQATLLQILGMCPAPHEGHAESGGAHIPDHLLQSFDLRS